MDHQDPLLNHFRIVNEESNRLITWSLSIIGGSLLAIFSTSYIEPTGWIKFAYLLFVFGWISISISIYFGEKVTRHYIASTAVPHPEIVKEIGREINASFKLQLNSFSVATGIFALWLIMVLMWWIFLKELKHL